MMPRRFTAIILGLALVLASVIAWPIETRASDPQPLSPAVTPGVDDPIARAIQFRETSGLRSDLGYVEAAEVNRAAFPDLRYGVPLSSAEGAEITRRVQLVPALAPARLFAAEQPDYAGSYFDNLGGGVPVFMFVGDPASHLAELAERLPPGTEFRLESATRTAAELNRIHAAIDAAWSELRSMGVTVRLTGIDDRRNVVVVGVDGSTVSAASALSARFGDGIAVRAEGPIELDTCVDRTNCASPLKGGIRITAANGGWCTSGYIGKVRNSVPVALRVLTAGHCIELSGGVGGTWSHHGVTIGTADMERWYAGTTADIGSIRASEGGDRNTFYAANNSDIRHVLGYEPVNTQLVGDTVCRSGATTLYLCGHIHLRDVTRDVYGRSVFHSWEVDFDASPGDSGAPYFAASTAYGIHTGSTDDGAPPPRYAWYSPIGWILSEAYVSLCVTVSCL